MSSPTVQPRKSRILRTMCQKPFENIVGKEENAGNQHFLLFLPYLLPFSKQISIFQAHLYCRLQMLSIWKYLTLLRVVQT